ncbi:putative reverse transcriptase domain-containing protein [Tanacetum coccineum]
MEKISERRHLGCDTNTLSLQLCHLGLTNALAVFMDLMNRVCKPYLEKFIIVVIDDILIYSKSKEDYEVHLKLVLELLKKEKLFAKFSKSNEEWKVPKTPSEIQSSLRLAGKANVVADALSRKERVKPRRIRAMAMTIHSGVKRMILAAQSKAFKQENTTAEILRDLDQQMEKNEDGVDRLTKSAHFLAIREDYKMENLARLYVDEIVAGHGKALGTRLGMSTTYHPQMDEQSKHTIQTLEDMLRACVIDFGGSWDVYLPLAEFSYNNSYHSGIRCAPFKALYRRKCRSPVLWAEIRESGLIGPELVQETTNKVVLIKKKLKAARDHQKSYADNRRKPLEFEVRDQVLLKVSP